MRLTCPSCGAVYDVPDGAIGPNGRKIRCRACATGWFEPARATPAAAPPPGDRRQEAAAPARIAPVPPGEQTTSPRPRRRPPWPLVGLVALVLALGIVAAVLAWGPRQVASRFGLAERRVPLGIAITRQPDWRLIAGGSQLFAISGRVWNPTAEEQPVPDIRAELHDRAGRTVYGWTISRPVARLAPHAAAAFDGAAVDVPPSSSRVSVGFADAGAP